MFRERSLKELLPYRLITPAQAQIDPTKYPKLITGQPAVKLRALPKAKLGLFVSF